MHDTNEDPALVMRWTLETDASGRTRPVAHWAPASLVVTASHPTIVEAA